MAPPEQLRALLAKPDFVVMPAVWDGLSAKLSAEAGFESAIGFDMGGTSTDVSLIERGETERGFETVVAGVRVRAPMLRIHTVAAGGGSLCRFDGFRLTVGPESAGASPGPLCYGQPAAREIALTDVNLFLGRIRGTLDNNGTALGKLSVAPVYNALKTAKIWIILVTFDPKAPLGIATITDPCMLVID